MQICLDSNGLLIQPKKAARERRAAAGTVGAQSCGSVVTVGERGGKTKIKTKATVQLVQIEKTAHKLIDYSYHDS